ncbi:MAG TPA: acetylxylan esterase [Acidobacteriaceae bacterium]|nr:acetylxylan esterase [Acidobacteriaceae bacterium]
MRRIILLAVIVCIGWSSTAVSQNSPQVSPGLHNMVDQYLTGIARRYWQARALRVSKLDTPAEVESRQIYVRKKYVELLGGFPARTPLHAHITGTLTRDGYRIEKLTFESLPNFYVTADVYVPTSSRGPYPAVLGTAGHSAAGKAEPIYQKAWIALAKRGFLVLAFDEVGLGERVQYWDPQLGRSRIGIASAEHTVMGMQSLLVGINLGMYVAWDGIRGIDYLLSRSDVDPKRIAVIGNSGGGNQSAVMALVDPRVAVAAPSCWMTSSKALWEQFEPQDAEQNVTGFLSSGLDYGDFPLAFAPRPYLFLTATQDFFPIAGAHATFKEAQRIYQVMGQPNHVALFEYNDTHGWSQPRREATYRWLEQWLMNRSDNGSEPPITVEPQTTLDATPTGQVATSVGGETIPEMTRETAQHLAASRPHFDAMQLRPIIAKRLGISMASVQNHRVPPVSDRGTVQHEGYSVETITLQTEPGIIVPALVFIPSNGPRRKPAILYANAAGKFADAGPDGAIIALVHAGNIVLAPDLRGWGESASLGGRPPRTGRYETTMRAFIVGKTMVGMQVLDLLQTLNYLSSRADVNTEEITLLGKGNGGVVALFAASLDARLKKTICEDELVSYLDLASTTDYDQSLFDVIVPGILKDFDLPDVAAAIAPRSLQIIDARSATEALEPGFEIRQEYATAIRAYQTLHAANLFRVSSRPGGTHR